MSVVRYSIIFNGDGTYMCVPAPLSITPGTTVTISAAVLANDNGAVTQIDLTGWTLIAAVIDDQTKAIRLYLTGSTAFTLTDADDGRFSLTIPYQMTQLLLQGRTYYLEIKGDNGDERRQFCYLPLTIQPTALASE